MTNIIPKSFVISVCQSLKLVFLSLTQCFFAGPNSPPSNVYGLDAIQDLTLFLQWGNVPAVDQNGVILSFIAQYFGETKLTFIRGCKSLA